jgi:hypothetical protein
MVATGFSICEASAHCGHGQRAPTTTSATSGDAVTLVTLYGSAAIGLVPLLGGLLGLRPEHARRLGGRVRPRGGAGRRGPHRQRVPRPSVSPSSSS